jgi:hypothetical protein
MSTIRTLIDPVMMNLWSQAKAFETAYGMSTVVGNGMSPTAFIESIEQKPDMEALYKEISAQPQTRSIAQSLVAQEGGDYENALTACVETEVVMQLAQLPPSQRSLGKALELKHSQMLAFSAYTLAYGRGLAGVRVGDVVEGGIYKIFGFVQGAQRKSPDKTQTIAGREVPVFEEVLLPSLTPVRVLGNARDNIMMGRDAFRVRIEADPLGRDSAEVQMLLDAVAAANTLSTAGNVGNAGNADLWTYFHVQLAMAAGTVMTEPHQDQSPVKVGDIVDIASDEFRMNAGTRVG